MNSIAEKFKTNLNKYYAESEETSNVQYTNIVSSLNSLADKELILPQTLTFDMTLKDYKIFKLHTVLKLDTLEDLSYQYDYYVSTLEITFYLKNS